ncbi:YccF domain-containing protein [Streptomyces mirabilis]|uniref:YccF domain-containing protein n=1 Tax=Streptomyces mirabilis TaxID=68239 RepID=UPI00324C5ADB
MKLFNLLLNILWLVFCGIWMAIGYLIAALVCFILIVTIPFGIASLRIAGFVLWPFGRTTVERPDAGAPSCIGNVLWLVFAGWWLALAHLITSIPLFVSIIGIPFGWANLKLIPISLMPLGREVVATDQRFGGR